MVYETPLFSLPAGQLVFTLEHLLLDLTWDATIKFLLSQLTELCRLTLFHLWRRYNFTKYRLTGFLVTFHFWVLCIWHSLIWVWKSGLWGPQVGWQDITESKNNKSLHWPGAEITVLQSSGSSEAKREKKNKEPMYLLDMLMIFLSGPKWCLIVWLRCDGKTVLCRNQFVSQVNKKPRTQRCVVSLISSSQILFLC